MEVKEEKVSSKFELPNEIVTVKFIPRKKGMAANVGDNHVISGGMLNNSTKTFRCPLKRSGGLVNILTNEEKEYLEEILGTDLSIYKDFWKTFSVKLFKDDASNKFDMSDPMGYISIKLLESLVDDVALSWAERNDKSTTQFVITRNEEVANEKKAKLDVKKDAFKLYSRIEDDKDKLVSILKLLSNAPVSSKSKLKWIQGKVEEYIDDSPAKFLSVVNDSNFETKALINKGVECGVIIRNGNKYSTVDGLELCESENIPTFDNAVRYLNSDKNQEVRALIEAKIDNAI